MRPDDIPQDVWDAADGATNAISGDLLKCLTGEVEGPADGLIQPSVARAILAERERCAKIADDLERIEIGYGKRTAASIAQKIRNG